MLRIMLGVGMVVQGVNHFIFTDFMVKMMPSYLPWHWALVVLSGVAEIVLGLAVFAKRTRRLAGFGLIALFLAVFPANIEMVLRPGDFGVSQWVLWARLPFQVLFIWWAYAVCIKQRPPATEALAPA